MPIGRDKNGDPEEKAIEGEVTSYNIAARPDTSALQLYRNFHNALAAAGWKLTFEESPYKLSVQKGQIYLYIETVGETYYIHS